MFFSDAPTTKRDIFLSSRNIREWFVSTNGNQCYYMWLMIETNPQLPSALKMHIDRRFLSYRICKYSFPMKIFYSGYSPNIIKIEILRPLLYADFHQNIAWPTIVVKGFAGFAWYVKTSCTQHAPQENNDLINKLLQLHVTQCPYFVILLRPVAFLTVISKCFFKHFILFILIRRRVIWQCLRLSSLLHDVNHQTHSMCLHECIFA